MSGYDSISMARCTLRRASACGRKKSIATSASRMAIVIVLTTIDAPARPTTPQPRSSTAAPRLTLTRVVTVVTTAGMTMTSKAIKTALSPAEMLEGIRPMARRMMASVVPCDSGGRQRSRNRMSSGAAATASPSRRIEVFHRWPLAFSRLRATSRVSSVFRPKLVTISRMTATWMAK